MHIVEEVYPNKYMYTTIQMFASKVSLKLQTLDIVRYYYNIK